MLYDLLERNPLFARLKLIFLHEAEEGDAAREDAAIIAGLKCVLDVIDEFGPLMRVVMLGNRGNAPAILLRNQMVLTVVHSVYEVGAHIILILFIDNDVVLCVCVYILLSLFMIVEFPLKIDKLS